MTIALGLMAADGLVLAADSEHSYGDYFKTSGQKVFFRTARPIGDTEEKLLPHGFGVTGSGTSAYIQAIEQTLQETYQTVYDHGMGDLEPAFAKALRDFYADNILPFANYPHEDRPDVSLIIGHECNYYGQIWATEWTSIRKCHNYAAVGVGSFFASSLLWRLYLDQSDVATMVLLAAYVIFQVKQHVPGCGQSTQAVFMRGGKARLISPNYIDELELIFKRFWQLERASMYYLFASRNPRAEWKDVSGRFRTVRREIEKYADKIRRYVEDE